MQGEPLIGERLAAAMAAADAESDDLWTHGFHTYPARMHSAIARALVRHFNPGPGKRVLDPFCGSGTVLVEAQVAGLAAWGSDLNPLSMRVAQLHCQPLPAAMRQQLLSVVQEVAAASEARVRSRVKVRAPLPRSEVVRYAPHVLLELAGLHAEIAAIEDGVIRRALEMVFSAMVVKFSRQRADTSEHLVEKRLRKGLVTEFFVRKAAELCTRWEQLAQALPTDVPHIGLFQCDVRELPRHLPQAQRADLVLSSPPYGGTYDYVQHHARRFPWLGMSSEQFAEKELGARRHFSAAPAGRRRWDQELTGALVAIAESTQLGAQVCFLLGDAQLGDERVDAAQQLAVLAPACGLRFVASAAQQRPDFRGGQPRQEHLVLLEVVAHGIWRAQQRRAGTSHGASRPRKRAQSTAQVMGAALGRGQKPARKTTGERSADSEPSPKSARAGRGRQRKQARRKKDHE